MYMKRVTLTTNPVYTQTAASINCLHVYVHSFCVNC